MIILGLDASSTNVGFTIYDSSTDKIERCWERHYKGGLAHRLLHIEREVEAVIDKVQPQVLACETPVFVRKRVQSHAVLSEVIGVLRLTAIKHDLEFMEINPSSVKVALAHGKASKQEMMASAGAVLGRQVTEHQADSIGVAFAAWTKIVQANLGKGTE